MFFGSDAIALAPFTDRITYLEDGDWAVLTRGRRDDLRRERRARSSGRWCARVASSLLVDHGNHRHFMAKEIHEQPEVVGHTLAHYLDFGAGRGGCRPTSTVDFAKPRPPVDHRLRHRLLRRAGRQVLVRALRAAAGRHRYRLRVPLPRAAADAEGAVASSSRSRARPPTRSPRSATPRAQGQKVGGDRQRPGVDDRARGRRRAADARRAGDRRRLDQGVHLPARGARRRSPSPPAGRAGTCPADDEAKLVRGAQRGAAPDERGAAAGAADRGARP